MRKIDDRLTLAASAHPALDADVRQAPDSPAALDALAAPASVVQAGKHGGGDGGVSTDAADPAHTTLALPGIGLGYASLDAMEDKENAFVLTASGLTVIASGALGYSVRSSTPMDAALGKILGFDSYSAFGGPGHDAGIGSLTPFAFSGANVDSDKNRGYDITGTSSAETILAGAHSDVIHGLAGNDSIAGAGGDDIAWGGAGNDSVDGGDGNDQLWGGAGLDTLEGGAGNDFLFGGSGNDSLQGGDGDDLMLGGTGNDSITGGDGDDVLVGGGGADTLTGLAGHDLFIFAEGDSGIGTTNQDHVADFTVGEDRLDLTSFTQPLHLVSAFDGHAYEMTLTDRADGTLISIDLNGDGTADQEIVVTTSDHSHLSSSDYVI